jgi:p-aminobenzoyl-glutamate transporter AbgT
MTKKKNNNSSKLRTRNKKILIIASLLILLITLALTQSLVNQQRIIKQQAQTQSTNTPYPLMIILQE